MSKVIAFCPADTQNLKFYTQMVNSLRKFHNDEELPVRLIDQVKVNSYKDDQFFYRATPIIAKELMAEGYDTVIKLDADQIVAGDLSELFLPDETYDVACVNNSNPRDFKNYSYTFLNIHPYSYVNCGLVVMRSKAFVDEWYDMCKSFLFSAFQMREQDILNILVHGGHYKIKRLDEGDSFYGLASKGYWPEITIKDNKLFLPKGEAPENWPDKDKWIKVIHFAGGKDPDKGNYRIRFQPDVVKVLDKLIKP